MNIIEYKKIKDLSYLEYCDYLQEKYGIPKYDYMTSGYNKNPRIGRTSEGLVAHHKYEDHAIMLSSPLFAKLNPFEWQKAKNIIYCDNLEHLLLHILICENPADDKNPLERVGYGGVVNFIAPEMNDYYSGWQPKQKWKICVLNKVTEDKDLYLELLKRFIKNELNIGNEEVLEDLQKSYNESYGLWENRKNKKIYKEIADIYKELIKES